MSKNKTDATSMSSDRFDDSADLSIEETNKLREKLGLKPLTSTTCDSVKQVTPITGNEVSADVVRQRVEASRARRARKDILQEGLAVLQDIASSTDLDSMRWLKNVGQQHQPNEQDESLEDDDVTIPENVRIAHSLENVNIKTGESMPFTLKDTSILDENKNLRKDDVVTLLENEHLREQEMRKKRQREKKLGGYNPVEGEDDDELLDEKSTARKHDLDSSKNILPHYDEWAIENRTLAKPDGYDLRHTFPLEQLERQTQYQKIDALEPITLSSRVGLQKDFYTEEEYRKMTTFKPPPKLKKNRIRRKITSQEEEAEHYVDQSSILKSKSKSFSSSKAAPIPAESFPEDDDSQFYQQLAKQKTVKPVIKPEATASLDNVVRMANLVAHIEKLEDPESLKKGFQSVGLVDIKPEESPEASLASLELSGATEFCRAVQTPSERMEEIQASSRYHSQFNSTRPVSGTHSDMPESGESSQAQLESNDEDDQDDASDEIPEQDKELVEKILSEESMDTGVTSALAYLKSKGQLRDDRVTRRGRRAEEHQPLHISTTPGDIKLEYRDDYGKIMTPKEAFRYISWVFHGKGPGKSKREKMMRKMEIEKKRKIIGADQNELPTMVALKKQQKKEQAYLVLNTVPTT